MFFFVQKFPEEQQNLPIFNSDCQNIILLDKIRESLNLLEHDIIDLVNVTTKECFMLYSKPKNYANEVLKQGETYLLVAVKQEKTKLDEEELKKRKKKSDSDCFDVKVTFVPVEQINTTAFDFTKIQPMANLRRARSVNKK